MSWLGFVSSITTLASWCTTALSNLQNQCSTISRGLHRAFSFALLTRLNLRARWSGITASALENVTTSLPEIQLHLLKLLTPPSGETPILLGHSLESDLRALKLCHPRCIDTALVYHHPRGRPLKPGLAWLAKKWCGREIQMRGDGGHDPEEDARACVELLRKKVESGPAFGEYKMDHESIFERMTRSSSTSSTPVRSAVVDHGNPGVMHGSKATTVIGCASDEDILKGLLNVLPSHDFVFGRFTGLADVMGCGCPFIIRSPILVK
jgi:RNA exonuclease 1